MKPSGSSRTISAPNPFGRVARSCARKRADRYGHLTQDGRERCRKVVGEVYADRIPSLENPDGLQSLVLSR